MYTKKHQTYFFYILTLCFSLSFLGHVDAVVWIELTTYKASTTSFDETAQDGVQNIQEEELAISPAEDNAIKVYEDLGSEEAHQVYNLLDSQKDHTLWRQKEDNKNRRSKAFYCEYRDRDGNYYSIRIEGYRVVVNMQKELYFRCTALFASESCVKIRQCTFKITKRADFWCYNVLNYTFSDIYISDTHKSMKSITQSMFRQFIRSTKRRAPVSLAYKVVYQQNGKQLLSLQAGNADTQWWDNKSLAKADIYTSDPHKQMKSIGQSMFCQFIGPAKNRAPASVTYNVGYEQNGKQLLSLQAGSGDKEWGWFDAPNRPLQKAITYTSDPYKDMKKSIFRQFRQPTKRRAPVALTSYIGYPQNGKHLLSPQAGNADTQWWYNKSLAKADIYTSDPHKQMKSIGQSMFCQFIGPAKNRAPASVTYNVGYPQNGKHLLSPRQAMTYISAPHKYAKSIGQNNPNQSIKPIKRRGPVFVTCNVRDKKSSGTTQSGKFNEPHKVLQKSNTPKPIGKDASRTKGDRPYAKIATTESKPSLSTINTLFSHTITIGAQKNKPRYFMPQHTARSIYYTALPNKYKAHRLKASPNIKSNNMYIGNFKATSGFAWHHYNNILYLFTSRRKEDILA